MMRVPCEDLGETVSALIYTDLEHGVHTLVPELCWVATRAHNCEMGRREKDFSCCFGGHD